MANILVIDPAPFWRDLAADGLRLKGHTVGGTEDALLGLAKLTKEGADLLILETQLTGPQGLDLVEQLRHLPQWKSLPIIILTSEMHKEQVIRARQLGVVDYLLKTQFSLRDLLERVDRRLDPRNASLPLVPVEPPATVPQGAPKQLLTRDQCLARAARAIGGRTLSGVVSQVIASASSPRTDMSELAELVGRDPMLSARVIAAANRLENASDRRAISNLMNAVRVTGSTTIKEIASSFWVYDAMPLPEPDGYNPIRCWQHSIAVARLCELLTPEEHRPIAYLLGLCHDLGEILFRSHFGTEYRQVLDTTANTGLPRSEVEMQMLGLTHGDLVQSIITQLELPEAILHPIAAFHAAMDHGTVPSAQPARLLLIADAFSSGLMLNSSDQTGVRPLHRIECRAATGLEEPPAIDCAQFRGEVAALTAECAHMSSRERADLIPPIPARRHLKVWLARDSSFSSFDPIVTALDPMVNLSIHNRLPAQTELNAQHALIVLARNNAFHGLTVHDVQQCIDRPDTARHPVLYLTGKATAAAVHPSITFATWPIPIPKLAAFINALK
jgi:HD-like signal output (HDOD) protein/CheY-like chemotaxis protein